MPSYSVTRQDDDNPLRQEIWKFQLIDKHWTLTLELDAYLIEERASKRHKFRAVSGSYQRLAHAREHGIHTLKEEPIVPQDVIDETIKLVASSIHFVPKK